MVVFCFQTSVSWTFSCNNFEADIMPALSHTFLQVPFCSACAGSFLAPWLFGWKNTPLIAKLCRFYQVILQAGLLCCSELCCSVRMAVLWAGPVQLQADTLTDTNSIIGRRQDCNENILISVVLKTLLTWGGSQMCFLQTAWGEGHLPYAFTYRADLYVCISFKDLRFLSKYGEFCRVINGEHQALGISVCMSDS